MKIDSTARLARLSPRVLTAGMAGVLAIFGVLTWAGLSTPLRELRTMKAEQVRLEMTTSDSSVLILQNRQLAARIAQLDGNLAKLNGQGVSSPLLVETISAVDQAAKRHGVTLIGAIPGPARATLLFEEIPFDIEASGGYQALINWMKDIERTMPTLSIVRFEIRSGEPLAPLAMTFRIATYRLPGGTP